MKDLVRLAIVALITLAAATKDSWADTIPGWLTILGMHCAPEPATCGNTQQVERCIGKSTGGGCDWCAGSASMRVCLISGVGCTISGAQDCGPKMSGQCTLVESQPDRGGGRGAVLMCVGAVIVEGGCTLATCQ